MEEGKAIEALGHEFGEWKVTKEPTATEEGSKERACTRCDEKETEVIPALGSGGSDNGGDNTNGGNNGSNTNGGNAQKPDNKPAKTGDTASAVPFMLGMAGCLGAAVEVIRRRFGK